MNPVKLKFRHGGEMLVSPIGIRFVEDPDHGPLVLIPELPIPRGYQLDMTLEEAEGAFIKAVTSRVSIVVDQLGERAATIERKFELHETRLDNQREATHLLEARLRRIEQRLGPETGAGQVALQGSVDDLHRRWQALQIHLGLPEGWEHLHELAAETKGALVSQREAIDRLDSAIYGIEDKSPGLWSRVRDLEGELSLLKEEAALFTLAERVGELEESKIRIRERLVALEKVSVSSLLADNERIRRWVIDESLKIAEALRRIERLESRKNEAEQDTAFPLLDDRTCAQRAEPTNPAWTSEYWSKPPLHKPCVGPEHKESKVEEIVIGGRYRFTQSPIKAGYEKFRGHLFEAEEIRPYDDPEEVVVLRWITAPNGKRLWDRACFHEDFTLVLDPEKKPKSAWKPLVDHDVADIGNRSFLARRGAYRGIILCGFLRNQGLKIELVLAETGAKSVVVPHREFHLYEFCPIPE